MKYLQTTSALLIAALSLFSSCSKDKDTKPGNSNNNSGGNTTGGGTNPPPASNETISYTVEFTSGDRAGTKITGGVSGLGYGGYSTVEDGEETLYTSFSHSDSITIAAYAALDANGKAKSLNTSSSYDSYVTLTIGNMLSGNYTTITSQSGTCKVSNITRDGSAPGSGSNGDVVVKKAAFLYEFEGVFKERSLTTGEEKEFTARGSINVRIPK